MYISGSTPALGANRARGQNPYKKASANSSAAKDSKNTDKAEFSSANPESGKILPERYKDSGAKIYYKGSIVTEYELLETAVKTGAVTLDETKSAAENQSKAMEALIYSKASQKYPCSSKLYSEDGMYVFRVENGQVTGMTKTWFDDGTTIFDVAKDLASGIMPCDIDPCKLDWLQRCDPELYEAACRTGSAKRSYFQETKEYLDGHLTRQQYFYEMEPIFLLFFGKNADVHSKEQHKVLQELFKRDDFASVALENYNRENQLLVDSLKPLVFH